MVSALAYHLPQFHPTAENDAWWGKGFTEWTNVARARPRFRGHEQPRLPRDLGFYDLRLAESRRMQADLAAQSGLQGFVFYHYWFNGRRLLSAPVDGILEDPEYRFPFCLSWANENWTRAWDGGASQILMQQSYSREDDRAHIRWLVGVMHDDRYITFDGKPVLLVHRASLLPHPRETTQIWRDEVARAGFPGLYLLRTEHFGDETGDPRDLGFDAAVDFQPNFSALLQASRTRALVDSMRPRQWRRRDRILDYGDVVYAMRARTSVPYQRWPGVFPGWDNSPRRARGALIIKNAEPDIFRDWVRAAKATAEEVRPDGLMFVNAWNEWAEGAALEPDTRHGDLFLQALKRGLLE